MNIKINAGFRQYQKIFMTMYLVERKIFLNGDSVITIESSYNRLVDTVRVNLRAISMILKYFQILPFRLDEIIGSV